MVRSLLKEKKDGDVYSRPKRIEAIIDAALMLDPTSLIARALLTDASELEYLPSECLVHLIREALRQRDDRTANALLTPLLQRCEANLLKTVSETAIPQAAILRESILSSFALMLAEDGSEEHNGALDYYECRFNSAFRTLRVDHIRAARTAQKPLAPLPESFGDEKAKALDEDALAKMSQVARHNPSQEDNVYVQQVLSAIDGLPPDLRRAVILCRILGYDEESVDPSKKTAATICGVTGRTIRNRLARADRQLKTLKENL